jgi:hypothetical protein
VRLKQEDHKFKASLVCKMPKTTTKYALPVIEQLFLRCNATTQEKQKKVIKYTLSKLKPFVLQKYSIKKIKRQPTK